MAGENQKPPLLKPFLLLLPLSLLFFIVLHSRPSATSISFSPPISSASASSPFIRIRRVFPSYDEYLKLQLNKTLDPRLRQLWATRDWDRKVVVFSQIFSRLQSRHLLANSSRALCVGARLGQEVAALKKVGVVNSVGMDLVPSPPLVVKGDFHKQPFEPNSFDFEFSNVFDHALYPDRFVAEMERTLKPGGVAVIHVALHRRGDKYSANDLLGVDGLVGLFKQSDLVSTEKVDAFGLDTEVVLRKRS
ncbi:S-adenosyl-L-methionine-dependent methyltransferases superfamily protein [Rhynchospora pubera]|uniref:S-adenosyl-L-methionine-dependent methyltransferases superfamily protein n=1 Tax=Rhynchospora pubera TaxID=906938 RepID=A0AAV8E1W2_9POAL|nr:S-adenosyl-L-methionine-dependent methyltransferases superfamily protein [Rhynchospora pubera]